MEPLQFRFRNKHTSAQAGLGIPNENPMALLTLQEIKDGLDREFLPLEPMLLGLRMIEKETSLDTIEHCENHLAVKFPSSFRNLIAAFDFGQLTIGPVVFCSSGDYLAELITLNERVNWWGDGERPSNLILIGTQTP